MPPWGKFALPEPKLEMVYVLLKNEQRYYEMSKAELQQDDWGRVSATKKRTQLEVHYPIRLALD
jgi:hypothetical protein